MSKPKIGFIGLGLMGSAMVQRLLDLNYPMTVMANKSRPNVDAAVARGAIEVNSPKEVAAASDIIMLCMDTSANVEARMRGEDGIIAGINCNAVIIDFGTSLPGSTQALAKEVSAAGGSYIDAPLGRTPDHGRQGQLNIMAAGDEAAYNKTESVLKDLGENVFYLGDSGTGHSIKLMNNFFGMTMANAMAEVFAMADKASIDRKKVYDVMSAGPLHSGMMDFVAAYGVDNDPTKLAFAIKNACKDVNYFCEMAKGLNADPGVAVATRDALAAAVEAGKGDDMVCQIIDHHANKA